MKNYFLLLTSFCLFHFSFGQNNPRKIMRGIEINVERYENESIIRSDTFVETAHEAKVDLILDKWKVRNPDPGQTIVTTITSWVIGEIEFKQTGKPMIGVHVKNDHEPNEKGTRITRIHLDGGAEEAGLMVGDIITHIENDRVYSGDDLIAAKAPYEIGDKIHLTYERDGEPNTILVTLKDQKLKSFQYKEPPIKEIKTTRAFLGVQIENGEDEGAYVTDIIENSAAQKAGLEEGDIIFQLNEVKIRHFFHLVSYIRNLNPGDQLKIKYLRFGKTKRAKVTLGERTESKEVIDKDSPEVDVKVMVHYGDETNLGDLARASKLEFQRFEYYPNPNNGRFQLEFELENNDDVEIKLFDLSGKEIYREKISDFTGFYSKKIQLPAGLAQGIYLLKVSQGELGRVERMVIR